MSGEGIVSIGVTVVLGAYAILQSHYYKRQADRVNKETIRHLESISADTEKIAVITEKKLAKWEELGFVAAASRVTATTVALNTTALADVAAQLAPQTAPSPAPSAGGSDAQQT